MAQEENSFTERLSKFGEWTPPNTTPPPQANGHAPGGTNPVYAAGAVELAVTELSAMGKDSGRNNALNAQAFQLGRYPDLDYEYVRSRLLGACAANGLLAEDGAHQCEKTFDSGWHRGRAATPRPVPAPGSGHAGGGYWIDPPASAGGNGSGPPGGVSAHDFDPRPLEGDFWERRSHQQIYTAALGRLCAPWAILAYCVARSLTMVRPVITLPPTIGGGQGSLNWFAAIISASGGGKSIAAELAAELIPAEVLERNLGSGEGMIGQYHRAGTKTEPGFTREAVMFVGDEGDTLTAMADRSGQDTMGVIRSGFSANTLGHSYITKGRDFHLKKHSYRMTLVINFPPARAGMLMADRGGTPQRFMFFPANDPRFDTVDDDEDPWVAPLVLPPATAWQYPRQLQIPPEARTEMRADRKARARGEGDPLDGHALFARAKLAFGLAVLDGRTEMSSEDWRLAGIAADVSKATRTWLLDQLAGAQRDEAVQKGSLLGVTQAAAAEEKTHEHNRRIGRVLMLIGRHLREAGKVGMTQREIHHVLASRDRDVMDVALNEMSVQGWIVFDAAQKRWFVA